MNRYRYRGTILMFAGLAVALAYSILTKPETVRSRYFEPDSFGKLVEVERPSRPREPLPPLFKPEPNLLLEHAAALGMSPEVRARIQAAQTEWDSEKAAIEARLASAMPKLDAGAKVSEPALASDLASYSELSRHYEARRSSHWNRAVMSLTPAQKRAFERLSSQTKKEAS